ncbi:bifunctional demethylmenaquinone methyltransferase/2-methoxy-6-polyprenyl-1,4-benzoquinol methylase UbiE [Pelagibacteraceae bacterium]|nr:bifunctional demethylmenaquinone methyltransferase/2-methoxy-6-polyprenyl-1,4-benzoquinol methylase UbiE [Pelagibacteraceae bacterium]
MKKDYNFGYTKVNSKQKTKLVQNVFSSVAPSYDIMNDLMSLGMHRLWKKRFVETVDLKENDIVLDVGSGSGDIASEILKEDIPTSLYLLDLNEKMLLEGRKRLKKEKNIKYFIGNAEKLNFENNFFDKYTISFCLRNVTEYLLSIKEAYRVLKPGGKYSCLEFSTPKSSLISSSYKIYKSRILPLLGELVAKDKNAYNYLSESIDLFPTQEELSKNLQDCGFSKVKTINLFNGIVAIHTGYKL